MTGYLLCLALAAAPTVEFVSPGIARVRWNADATLCDNATGACIYTPAPVEVTETTSDGSRVIKTSQLECEIKGDGTLVFRDAATGRTLLTDLAGRRGHERVAETRAVYDDATARSVQTANGMVTVKDTLRVDTVGMRDRYSMTFAADAGEAVYGLGSHMEDYMNLVGKQLWLTQHNMKVMVPVLNSTGGYGLLIDAGCSMAYDSRVPEGTPGTQEMTLTLEDAATVDYYLIKGETMHDVAGGYRWLTGAVSMMPRYLFGYTQSKERYVSSADILATLREYRRRHVPVDMIVQDWNYWPEGWGYMKMDPRHYPDPKALADSVHALDAKLMVSIWPNPQWCPQEKDFRDRGMMLEHSVYDVFSPAARDRYWEYADGEFFSRGFDAWWCDSSEPLDGDWNGIPEPVDGKPYGWDDHRRRWQLNDRVLSEALGSRRACLYSLYHSMGIHDHQRAACDTKRVVNLTRSSFAGQQRYGTVVWNGDTHASWQSFRQQIPSGLNYLATGNPYWTVDIGSFFTGSDGRWFRRGEFPEGVRDDGYKEYYVRMLQWCAFMPMMRSHGTDTPREIWNFGEPGTPYHDAIVDMIRLRYALLPYSYSMAARQSSGSYTMARPLAFDFASDRKVHDIKDQYMYGDLMVCPVTEPTDRREVYLPQGDAPWYDFWTGEKLEGGRTVTAEAPISRLPVYARGGSLLVSCEPQEHSGATAGKPLLVTVYPGADATFTLYDDAGDGYAYERGEWQRIRLDWNDSDRKLTLRKAEGTYPGAPGTRIMMLHIGNAEKTVEYKGEELEVAL